MNQPNLVYVVGDKNLVLFATTIYTLEKRIQNFQKESGIKFQYAKNITTNFTARELILWHQNTSQLKDGWNKIIG